eukprot:EG_transcript_3861
MVTIVIPKAGSTPLQIEVSCSPGNASVTEFRVWCIPGWLSLFPPVVVIAITVWLHHVVFALFMGIFVAAAIIHQGNIGAALLRTVDFYIANALADADHVKILMFSWLLAGMVGIIHKSGAGYGLAAAIMGTIRSRRGVQLAAIALGVAIFFDDYANALILGATLRHAFDQHLVSREKLCFLVDCTAAPVASVAPVSSWIGFELSLIQEQIDALVGLGEGDALRREGVAAAYPVFLRTIPGRFYSICMLCFVLATAVTGRDFGPMLKAERRALLFGQVSDPSANLHEVSLDPGLEPAEDVPRLWWNAVAPIAVTICAVLTGLVCTGWMATSEAGDAVTLIALLGNGDAFNSIVWGAMAGISTAVMMCRLQYRGARPACSKLCAASAEEKPILTVAQSTHAALEGVKGLTGSVITLLLAWAIGKAVQDVGCARYIAHLLTAGVAPAALPGLTFLAAALISLCTGTSWGTMAILFPAVLPAAWLAARDGQLWVLVISAILAGSVFGDHASTISDTTIISAMACRCDLRHHVLTQGAYCATTALIALLFGYLGSGYLWPVWVGLLASMAATVALVLLLAVPVDDERRRPDALAHGGALLRRLFASSRRFSRLRGSGGALPPPGRPGAWRGPPSAPLRQQPPLLPPARQRWCPPPGRAGRGGRAVMPSGHVAVTSSFHAQTSFRASAASDASPASLEGRPLFSHLH